MRLPAAAIAAIAVLPLAVAGCATDEPGTPAAPALPAGVTSADATVLYAARFDAKAGRTTVSAHDRASRKVLRSRTLDGRWVIPALVRDDHSGTLSGDGDTIALARPGGERETRLALLDTGLRRAARTFTLPGRWSFDALSPDAKTVYLIEHGRGGHYQVRAYDAAAGRLHAQAIIEKGETDPDMTGVPLAREIASGGSPVYTLYREGAAGAFVHALDTREGTALCVDLPAGRTWKLAWVRARLYAVDRVTGARVRADAV